MGIVDTIEKKAIEWLWQKAAKKIIVRGVTLLVAWIMGLGLQRYGIEVNAEGVTAAIYLGLEALRNWLKVKFPKIGAYI